MFITSKWLSSFISTMKKLIIRIFQKIHMFINLQVYNKNLFHKRDHLNLLHLIRIAKYNNIYCSNNQQLGKTISECLVNYLLICKVQ